TTWGSSPWSAGCCCWPPAPSCSGATAAGSSFARCVAPPRRPRSGMRVAGHGSFGRPGRDEGRYRVAGGERFLQCLVVVGAFVLLALVVLLAGFPALAVFGRIRRILAVSGH